LGHGCGRGFWGGVLFEIGERKRRELDLFGLVVAVIGIGFGIVVMVMAI